MEVMSPARYRSDHNGAWNLPPVRDLLHHPQPQHETYPRPAAASPSVCPTCSAKGRQVFLNPGGVCSHCRPQPALYSRHPASSVVRPPHMEHGVRAQPMPVTVHQQARQPSLAIPNRSPSPLPLSGSSISIQPRFQPTIPDASQLYNRRPSYQPPLESPSYMTASYSAYPLPSQQHRNPSTISTSTVSSNSATATKTAARQASDNRHKLSEKHRRDGMGAYVLAGHALRTGITPGIMKGCEICIAEAASAPPSNSSSVVPVQVQTPVSTFSSNPESKTKIPKNNMLSDGLWWDFGIVLHFAQDKITEHVERIRALALQTEEEKMQGLRNDHARKKKWQADIRGEVLFDVVSRMQASMREHGIPVEDSDAVPSTGWRDVVVGPNQGSINTKRDRDETGDSFDDEARYGKRRSADVPTPPSSRGSPLM